MGKNVTSTHTHIITEYPKWVDGVLIQDEDHEMELENVGERDRMVKELDEVYGKKVDLRQHKGAVGFGSLKAYYESVVNREGGEDGNSGDSD